MRETGGANPDDDPDLVAEQVQGGSLESEREVAALRPTTKPGPSRQFGPGGARMQGRRQVAKKVRRSAGAAGAALPSERTVCNRWAGSEAMISRLEHCGAVEQVVGRNVLISLVALLSAVSVREATVVFVQLHTSTNWAMPERSGRTNMAPWPAYGPTKNSSSRKAGAA